MLIHECRMMATSSEDQSIKIFDISDPSQPPVHVTTKEMAAGKLFDVSFCFEDPFLLSTGGSTGTVALWDIRDDKNVMNVFGKFDTDNYHAQLPINTASASSSSSAMTSTPGSLEKTKKSKDGSLSGSKKKYS